VSETKLKPEDLDRLAEAVIALTEEVWVLRDRQKVLEAVLEKNGLLAEGQTDLHQADEALSADLASERQALIDRVLGALKGD